MVSKLLISYVAITNLSELPLTKCLDKVHHKAKVFHKITQKNAETLYEAWVLDFESLFYAVSEVQTRQKQVGIYLIVPCEPYLSVVHFPVHF